MPLCLVDFPFNLPPERSRHFFFIVAQPLFYKFLVRVSTIMTLFIHNHVPQELHDIVLVREFCKTSYKERQVRPVGVGERRNITWQCSLLFILISIYRAILFLRCSVNWVNGQ